MHQHEPIEAGRARSGTSAPRRAEQRDDIDTLKARMRAAVASLGMPRHETQAAFALIDTWQRGKGLFPEQATIAGRAFYGERRTRDALKALRDEHDLITWERRRYRGVQTSNLYEWTPRFWAIVNAWGGCATAGKKCRPQAAKSAVRRRQPLPTNGEIPFSERSSLNGIQRGAEAPATTEPPSPAPPPEASPFPSFSEQQAEGALGAAPFLSDDDDPAFVELTAAHAAAHAARYRAAIEATGQRYSAHDAGTIRRDFRPAVALELRNLAARAHALALGKHRDDLTPDAIRVELTAGIVAAYMAQDRTWLREHRHCLGGLWGNGGNDGKPCDLLALAPRVLERWAEALDPGHAPDLAEVLHHAPPNVEHQDDAGDADDVDDTAEIRDACAELRALAQVQDEPHELAPVPELAELPEPRTAAEIRDALERIDAEAREAAPRRPRILRGGRAHLATRPRERLALLAALMALAAPAALDGHDHAPPDEAPAAPSWTSAAAPLLRDARERPARRAPRRSRAPRRRT